MTTDRLARARQRLMTDPAFAADVARENVAMAELDRERLRHAAMARVRARYSWDAVTDAYEGLLKGMR